MRGSKYQSTDLVPLWGKELFGPRPQNRSIFNMNDSKEGSTGYRRISKDLRILDVTQRREERRLGCHSWMSLKKDQGDVLILNISKCTAFLLRVL